MDDLFTLEYQDCAPEADLDQITFGDGYAPAIQDMQFNEDGSREFLIDEPQEPGPQAPEAPASPVALFAPDGDCFNFALSSANGDDGEDYSVTTDQTEIGDGAVSNTFDEALKALSNRLEELLSKDTSSMSSDELATHMNELNQTMKLYTDLMSQITQNTPGRGTTR